MLVGPLEEMQLGRAATGPRAEREPPTPLDLEDPQWSRSSKQTWAVRQEGPMKKTGGGAGVGQLRSRVAGTACQRTALPGHPGSKMQAVLRPQGFLPHSRGLLWGPPVTPGTPRYL